MKQLIETYSHEGDGYNPFLIREKWQVAQLNYTPEMAFDAIDKVEVHAYTDEVFILFKGTAVLIAAEKDGDKLTFQTVNMKAGVTYNIPVGVWHYLAMSTDAQLIIIEDANTHLQDVAYYYLSDEQKNFLYKLITIYNNV
jgi:mannose-6-phosphate isomerase-like protein (cupin superfamily)